MRWGIFALAILFVSRLVLMPGLQSVVVFGGDGSSMLAWYACNRLHAGPTGLQRRQEPITLPREQAAISLG